MVKRTTASGAASAASTETPSTGNAPGAGAVGAGASDGTGTSPIAPDAAALAAKAAEDAAKQAAAAKAAAEAANAAPTAEVGGPSYPLNVVIRNHGTLAFPEPVTGAFLPGGGSATVTLHDEDFADAVRDSLISIVEKNYLAPGALAVDPA